MSSAGLCLCLCLSVSAPRVPRPSCNPRQRVPTRRRPTSFWLATSSLSATNISAARSPVPVEASGIHDMSLLSTTKSDVDIRKDLFDNVVMHYHAPKDRRTHDEGVDYVGVRRYLMRIGVCLVPQYFPAVLVRDSSLTAGDITYVIEFDCRCVRGTSHHVDSTCCCCLFSQWRLHQ